MLHGQKIVFNAEADEAVRVFCYVTAQLLQFPNTCSIVPSQFLGNVHKQKWVLPTSNLFKFIKKLLFSPIYNIISPICFSFAVCDFFFYFGWCYFVSHSCFCGYMQPDTITGNVIFVLQQKNHSKFRRKSDDLYVEHNLSLAEALCGFQFVLTHLDGRQLLIKSHPGEVIKPGKESFNLCVITL